MESLPVIARELLAGSRNPASYRLRLVVGLVATIYLAGAAFESGNNGNAGRTVFFEINRAAILMLVFVGAVSAADSISKERREGTLNLLYLTPMRAPSIVQAKFAGRVIQVGSAALVLLPILAVTLLMGGVSQAALVAMVLVMGAAVTTGLSAGILASSLCRQALPATVLALIFAALGTYVQWCFLEVQSAWPPSTERGFIVILASNLVLAMLGSYLALSIAASRTALVGEEDQDGDRKRWLRTVFLTPCFWKDQFRRSMRRRIERNPLVWLEYRSAWRRSARWLLVLVLVIAETYVVMISERTGELMFFQAFLGLIISLLVGVTSAGSFKVEKESGALELLLVAPLNQNAIIKDRIKAVWAYYKPLVLTWAAFLWFVAANFPSASYSYSGMIGGTVLSTFLSMYTLPLAGLYFALRLKSYLGILLATLLAGAILPLFGWIWLKGAILFIMYGGARWMSFKGFPLEIAVIATHTYLWRRFYQQVHDRLTAREFE